MVIISAPQACRMDAANPGAPSPLEDVSWLSYLFFL
jgi:hypothetical protein